MQKKRNIYIGIAAVVLAIFIGILVICFRLSSPAAISQDHITVME